MTLLEEFVDRFIKDPKLAAQVSQFGLVLYGRFNIARRVSKYMAIVVDESTKKEYQVKFRSKLPGSYEGVSFSGYIHPWKDEGAYRATGILTFERVPNVFGHMTNLLAKRVGGISAKEVQDESEAKSIPVNATLSGYLWRQPIIQVWEVGKFLNVPKANKREMIARMNDMLAAKGMDILKSLSKELSCLLYLYRTPQKAVKHKDLERRFGNDDFCLPLF